ncbi:unnamed protein product, partial [Pylaiella littoralis]
SKKTLNLASTSSASFPPRRRYHSRIPRAIAMARLYFCPSSRLLAIVVFLAAATIPIAGVRVRGRKAEAQGPVPLSTGNPGSGASATARGSRRPPPSHLVDGYRSTPAFPSSLLCFPAASSSSPPSHLPRALRTRGGANLVPPQKTDGGTGSSSRPVLGPITRRGAAADSVAKDGAALEDGQQEFLPQFLDFQSRVGFMKKVYLTVSVQLIYTGLVCTLMRGYREQILRLLFGHGPLPQVLFFVSTMATIIWTQAIMWNNVELRQSFPRNLPLLTAFTSAWAFYVGVFALMFTQGSVTRAVFQAAFVVGPFSCSRRVEERQSSRRLSDGVRVPDQPQARADAARRRAVLRRECSRAVLPHEALLFQGAPCIWLGIVVPGDALFQPLPRVRHLQDHRWEASEIGDVRRQGLGSSRDGVIRRYHADLHPSPCPLRRNPVMRWRSFPSTTRTVSSSKQLDEQECRGGGAGRQRAMPHRNWSKRGVSAASDRFFCILMNTEEK